MRFSIRFADKIVGTFVILALAILVFVVFMLGTNQRWFIKDYEYKSYFSSAQGISANMPVLHRGFTIGHVKGLRLTDDDRVEVTFTIFQQYAPRVTEGSIVEVQISPIGLGNSFHLYFGRGPEQKEEGSVIPEINSLQARMLVSMGLTNIPRATDSISNIMNQINAILETVNISLSGSVGAEEHTLGQLLINLNTAISNVNPLLEQASDPSGAVMSFLDGQGELYQSIESTLASIAEILGTEGTFYQSIEQTIVSLAGIIQNLERTSEFLPAQLPQIAVLINELNAAVRTLDDVLKAVANNPLLRGGIPERRETPPGGASPRNLEF